jgi:hypothetical protein
MKRLPVLHLEPMPMGYQFSPFQVPPKQRRKIGRTSNDEVVETQVSVKKGGICGIEINDPEIHRRTMAHRAPAELYNWDQFDKIADEINNNNHIVGEI